MIQASSGFPLQRCCIKCSPTQCDDDAEVGVRNDLDEINTSVGRLVVAIRKRSACQAGFNTLPYPCTTAACNDV